MENLRARRIVSVSTSRCRIREKHEPVLPKKAAGDLIKGNQRAPPLRNGFIGQL